jgi:hypothetical protein
MVKFTFELSWPFRLIQRILRGHFLTDFAEYAIVKVLFPQITLCAKSGEICECISAGLVPGANPNKAANRHHAVRRHRCL